MLSSLHLRVNPILAKKIINLVRTTMPHLKQITKISIFKSIKCHNKEKKIEDSFNILQQNTKHTKQVM
jgi:hypothetical protein